MQHPTRVCVMLLACTCLFIYKIHQDLGNSMILSGNVQVIVFSNPVASSAITVGVNHHGLSLQKREDVTFVAEVGDGGQWRSAR